MGQRRRACTIGIGLAEVLIFLLVAAATIYYAGRGRIPSVLLAVLVVILSPMVPLSLALVVGTFLAAFAPA